MSSVVENKTGEYMSFPVIRRKLKFNKQEDAAPHGKTPLTPDQAASQSVSDLVAEGKLSKVDGGVENLTNGYLSFPTDGRVISLTRQVTIIPDGTATLTDEEAQSEAVAELIERGDLDGDIDPSGKPDPVIDGEGYAVTVSGTEPFAIKGGGTASVKVTITPDGRDFADEDKEGWEGVSKTGKMTVAAPTFTKAGVATFQVKHPEATLATANDTITVKRGGKAYANVKVVATPVVNFVTDSPNLLTTDSPVTVTALKVNGIEVDQGDYTLTSDDATVKFASGAYSIAPKGAGTCKVTVSDGKSSSDVNLVFTAPAASIDGVYYKTIAAAFKAAASGAMVKLEKDVTESVNYTGNAPRAKGFALDIDLNGHEWKGTANQMYALRVDYGTVTIDDSKGGGKVTYGKDYAFVVSHVAGDYDSKLALKAGEFTGQSTVAQCGLTGGTGSNLKYYGGELVVEGGTFKTVKDTDADIDPNGNFRFTLNMLDMVESKYPGGIYSPSVISVKGGSFEKFDPADCYAEGAGTNFVADGYKSVKDGDIYTVSAE